MADINIDFDSPQSSSTKSVNVIGTVPANSPPGYVRITVNITSPGGRDQYYYRTIPISASITGGSFHNTYNVAISPRILSTHTATSNYSFSFTNKL